MIKSDSYTIAEICNTVGIHVDTYYDWYNNKTEFSENIKKAKGEFDDYIANEARKSLVKLIKGYDIDETKTVYVNDITGKPKIKEKTTVKKHFQPNTGAVIFALTNRDSENWKNRQNTEVTGKDGKDLFANVPDDELDARIAELEKKLGK
jgi:hypothetical protein